MTCCRQVGQSLQRFGLSEDTDQILVASFHMNDPDVRHLCTMVQQLYPMRAQCGGQSKKSSVGLLCLSQQVSFDQAAKVLSIVEGEPADLHTLSSLTDLATVKKVRLQPSDFAQAGLF